MLSPRRRQGRAPALRGASDGHQVGQDVPSSALGTAKESAGVCEGARPNVKARAGLKCGCPSPWPRVTGSEGRRAATATSPPPHAAHRPRGGARALGAAEPPGTARVAPAPARRPSRISGLCGAGRSGAKWGADRTVAGAPRVAGYRSPGRERAVTDPAREARRLRGRRPFSAGRRGRGVSLRPLGWGERSAAPGSQMGGAPGTQIRAVGPRPSPAPRPARDRGGPSREASAPQGSCSRRAGTPGTPALPERRGCGEGRLASEPAALLQPPLGAAP